MLYFKLFGSVYLFDGVLGLVTGSGCLDGGIFINGFRSFDDIDLPVRFFANAPHLAIGGFAVFVGFWLSKRVSGQPGARPERGDVPAQAAQAPRQGADRPHRARILIPIVGLAYGFLTTDAIATAPLPGIADGAPPARSPRRCGPRYRATSGRKSRRS